MDLRSARAAPSLSDLPRAGDGSAFSADPFLFLRQAAAMGPLVVLRDGPIFSRRADCPVTLAAFGAEAHRQVLCDGSAFALPPSAAEGLGLPGRLKTLNRGLHSMSGARHRTQKRILSTALASSERLLPDAEIAAEVDAALDGLADGRMPVLATMRRLLGTLAARILFGEAPERDALAAALADYFHRRRAASSPLAAFGRSDRERLVESGLRADEMLRREIARVRASPGESDAAPGLLHRLAASEGAADVDDDERIAHTNVLFMSMTEPVAVALAWTFLLLSQLPRRQAHLRASGQAAAAAETDRFVAETLRLLTPNALMVRSVRTATDLLGTPLPAGAEIVLAPIVAHRDPAVFPQPDLFDPERWRSARPEVFDYMPFGGGGHLCIGQRLANRLIRTILLHIVSKYDLSLADRAPVDWQIDIMLKPRHDFYLALSPAGSAGSFSMPEWQGPSRALIQFEPRLVDR